MSVKCEDIIIKRLGSDIHMQEYEFCHRYLSVYSTMSNWFEEIGGKALAFVDQVADNAINNLNAAQTELEEENTKFREEAKRQGLSSEQNGDIDQRDMWFDKAAQVWSKAVRLYPGGYLDIENWLKTSGRSSIDIYL